MNVKFKCSSSKLEQLPADGLPEIALIGRSNVGKSSLINMLSGVNGLAKVSASPGKTRLINHFLVDGRWYLVDLPGYGYAKVSKSEQRKFAGIITDYVTRAPQLHYLFVLIDSRLEPQRIDLEFVNLLGQHSVPFGLIFTKTDKQKPSHTAASMARFAAALADTWETSPPMFPTSSSKREGGEAVMAFIEGLL